MRRYFQAGSSRPASGSGPGLWMIRAPQGEESGEGTGTCAGRQGPGSLLNKSRLRAAWTAPVHCERRGLFHCRPLDMEGAAESRSAMSSSQNRVVGAGSTRDPHQSQRPALALETDSRPR